MRKIITTAVVLRRLDFQEADRIVTVLTPDYGKVSLMARGVRKAKSKMAGGIELFSISEVSFIPSRGDINTLVSSRLQTHFGSIVNAIDRTLLGYDLLKRIDRVTEDGADSEYYDLVVASLKGLDDESIPNDVLDFWFNTRLLQITGHAPTLDLDTEGQSINKSNTYTFNNQVMAFEIDPAGVFLSNHIRLIRLTMLSKDPKILTRVQDIDSLLPLALSLTKATLGYSTNL